MKKSFSKVLKQFLCFILVTSLSIGTLLGISAQKTSAKNQAPLIISELQLETSPKDLSDATDAFARALENIVHSGELSGITQMLARFSGALSAVSGCISILEMMGVIKDPTEEKLSEILDTVKDMQTTLSQMDAKLDQIIKDIQAIAVDIKETARADKADTLLKNWIDFRTNYIEPLNTYADQYSDKLALACMNWWESATKADLTLLYATVDDKLLATFSTSDGVPASGKADNEEDIAEWMLIPAAMLTESTKAAWDADHYKDNFTNAFVSEFTQAADNKTLTVSEGSSFYARWDALDADAKAKLAAQYADDCFATLDVHNAYAIVNDQANADWVTNIIDSYKNYCSNLLTVKTGIDAIYNVYYGTHAFESEVKNTINDLGTDMIAATGVYGQLALSVAGMSRERTTAQKEEVRDVWANTTLKLKEKNELALTGYDNYCYIVGGLVSFDTYYAKSTITFDYKGDLPFRLPCAGEYEDLQSTPWKIYDSSGNEAAFPAIIGDVQAVVLYDQYRVDKDMEGEVYAKFLNTHGVNISEDFNSVFTTSVTGAQTFALSEGINMKAQNVYHKLPDAGGDVDYTFYDGHYYKINTTGEDDDDFWIHDKFVHSFIKASDGTTANNAILIARAAYIDKSALALYDNGVHFSYFGENGGSESDNRWKEDLTGWHWHNFEAWDRVDYSAPMYVLKVSPLPQEIDSKSPLLANDSYYVIKEDTKTPLPDETQGNWADFDTSSFYCDDSVIQDSYLYNLIEDAVNNASEKGTSINLSDVEKANLVKEMRETVEKLRLELANNQSIKDENVFNLSDEQKEALAKEILLNLSGYNSEYKVSAENIKIMLNYEVTISLSFSENNGKVQPIINPMYNVTPVLVYWDSLNNSFEKYNISDETIEKLGLMATVKLPVSADSDKTVFGVTHYNSLSDMKILEQKNVDVKGSGTDKYVELSVASLSPFELADAFGVDTGDHSNTVMYMSLIIMGAAATAVTVLAKRKNLGNN